MHKLFLIFLSFLIAGCSQEQIEAPDPLTITNIDCEQRFLFKFDIEKEYFAEFNIFNNGTYSWLKKEKDFGKERSDYYVIEPESIALNYYSKSCYDYINSSGQNVERCYSNAESKTFDRETLLMEFKKSSSSSGSYDIRYQCKVVSEEEMNAIVEEKVEKKKEEHYKKLLEENKQKEKNKI